jgi:hypothetical protein
MNGYSCSYFLWAAPTASITLAYPSASNSSTNCCLARGTASGPSYTRHEYIWTSVAPALIPNQWDTTVGELVHVMDDLGREFAHGGTAEATRLPLVLAAIPNRNVTRCDITNSKNTYLWSVSGLLSVVFDTMRPSSFSSRAISAMSCLSSSVRSGAIFTNSGIWRPS